MFWGIFWVLLKSLESIFRKKSLDQSKKITPLAFDFFWSLFWVLIWGFFYFLKIEGNYDYSPKIIAYILIWIVFRLSSSYLMQRVYRNEKLSVITPYENTNEILSIILAYFIFRDVSLTSFCIAIGIMFFTVIYTVDFQKLKFPRFFWTFFIAQLFLTLYYICIWFIVREISYTEYFALESLFAVIILFTFVLKQRQISILRHQTHIFYKSRIIASLLWYAGFILWIYIVSEYGLLLSMIFSFMYVIFTMIFSFLFFRDIPKLKSILFALIVTCLVAIWFYNR